MTEKIPKELEKAYKIANKIQREYLDNSYIENIQNALQVAISQIKSIVLKDMPGLDVMWLYARNYIERAEEDAKLTQEQFEAKYKERIEISRSLGRKGWVISPYFSGNDFEKWVAMLAGGEEEYLSYFIGGEFNYVNQMFEELEQAFIDSSMMQYFDSGRKSYETGNYMAAAMCWMTILESKTNEYIVFPPISQSGKKRLSYADKFSEYGLSIQKQIEFKKLGKQYITKLIYFTEWYPSLIEYLNRVFVDGKAYNWSKCGKEPDFLNRNWLMHGKMTKDVGRILRTFKIKKNVEVTDNGKIII